MHHGAMRRMVYGPCAANSTQQLHDYNATGKECRRRWWQHEGGLRCAVDSGKEAQNKWQAAQERQIAPPVGHEHERSDH